MKRITSLAAVIAGFFLFGANTAFASATDPGCAALGGNDTGLGTTCTLSGTQNVSGSFTLGETLHMLNPSTINTGGADITIHITSGDFLMDANAKIDASLAAGIGGAITVTLDAGDVDLAPGSIIRSNGKSGGAIAITTAPTHLIDIDGLVESVGTSSGTGSTQAPGGGTITIVAGCELTVSDDGKVSSRGADPGADLVHLEGCTVVIDGLVESTGPGHVLPNIPGHLNHCNLDTAAHPLNGNAFYSACVEIWGNTVTINSILPHKGEVRTDPPGQRAPGRGWIDVFSRGDITINNDTTGPYSVHANAEGSTNTFGGLITVKSSVGKFTASGFAIQANTTGGGGNGGDVIVQAGGAGAAGDVAFGSSSVQAKAPNGSNTAGGHISAKSFNGSVTGTFVTTTAGELNAAGGLSQTTPVPGTVLLEACIGNPLTTYAGTVTGTETDHGPGAPYCGGTPTFPAVAQWFTGISATQFIANAATCATTRCGGTCTKTGQKFNDLNNNHAKDAGEPGLQNWTITLWNSTQTALVAVPLPSVNPATTDATGNYSFSGLAPDTYVVCETPQAGWNQTFPVAGAGVVTCTNTSPTTLGYQFTLAFNTQGVCADTGNDFGNNHPSHKSGMKFNDVNGNGAKDPGDSGISGWPINLYKQSDLTTIIQTVNTDASGNYKFTIPAAGDYQACEGQKAGVVSNQTFPNSGTPVPPGETAVVNTCPLPNVWGYTFTVTTGNEFSGDDFGNHTTTSQCPEDPTAALTKTVGNPGSGVPNFDTVQAAYNAAVNGDVIGMFSNTVENVVLGAPNGDKTLEITQCTVAKITAADNSLPVWSITSTGKLTIIGPDSVGGNIGWWVGGNGGHTLKSVRANGASLVGIAILSDKNTVSWNDVSGNGPGAGIVVVGGSNSLKGGTVGPNTGDGVQLQGNSNSLSGATLNSNTGSGVVVSGSTNTIKSNKANSNGFDGFWNFAGAGNTYSGNSSNTGGVPNGLHQYEFATAGVNGGSNRADGVNVPKTSAPTKCVDFAQAGTSCD